MKNEAGTPIMEAEDVLGALRAELQSNLLELSNRERQLGEIREVLHLGREATHPQTLSAIGQLRDKVRAARRRARLAAMPRAA